MVVLVGSALSGPCDGVVGAVAMFSGRIPLAVVLNARENGTVRLQPGLRVSCLCGLPRKPLSQEGGLFPHTSTWLRRPPVLDWEVGMSPPVVKRGKEGVSGNKSHHG